MLRETSDRLKMAGQIVRPPKPHFTDPEHAHKHHAVHMATNWLHELTDAPIAHLHDEFATTHHKKHHVSAERLHEIATELMEHLYAHDDVLAPHDYSAIYYQISQGLIPVKETT